MRVRFACMLGAAGLCLLASGCGVSRNGVDVAASGMALRGMVHGGQQPVIGAKVYMFAAGTTGYGSAPTSLLQGAGVTSDGSGNGYVTTDATGTFTISGDYTCPSASSEIYVEALGGNPGLAGNVDNASLAMMAVAGVCGSLTTATFIRVDEQTTVEAAYSLAQFTSVVAGTGSGRDGFATSATNASGLMHAVGTVASIQAAINYVPPVGTLPNNLNIALVQTVNTLANVLAACVNTDGSGGLCASLMTAATPQGGTAPIDTLQAVVNIAHRPGNNVAAIFALASAIGPFQPMLGTSPNDWTLRFDAPTHESQAGGTQHCTLTSSTYPQDYAVDGLGRVWDGFQYPSQINASGLGYFVTDAADQVLTNSAFNTYSYVGLIPDSLAVSVSGQVWYLSGYCPGSSRQSPSTPILGMVDPAITTGNPYSIVATGSAAQLGFDATGRLWLEDGLTFQTGIPASNTSPPVVSIASTGTTTAMAFDSAGNLWATTMQNGLTRYALSGASFASTSQFSGGGLSSPIGLALDHAGDIWVVNGGSHSLSKFGADGSALSGPGGFTGGGVQTPTQVVVDGDGNVWVASYGPAVPFGQNGSLSEFDATGRALTATGIVWPLAFVPGNIPKGSVVIDTSGDVWVFGAEVVGAAAPVVTPLSVAVRDGRLGVRP